jgi:hypothetical protein
MDNQLRGRILQIAGPVKPQEIEPPFQAMLPFNSPFGYDIGHLSQSPLNFRFRFSRNYLSG